MAVGLVPIARARRRAVTPSTPWARYRRRAARRMDVRRSQTRREERPGEGLRLVNTVNQAMAPIDAPSQAPPGRRRSGGRSATDEAGALVDVQAARTLAAVVVADLRALARRCERSGEAEAQRDQGSGRRWIGPVASGDREAHDARLVRVRLEDDALDAARRVLCAALELPGIDAPVPPPDLGRGVEGHRGQRDVDGNDRPGLGSMWRPGSVKEKVAPELPGRSFGTSRGRTKQACAAERGSPDVVEGSRQLAKSSFVLSSIARSQCRPVPWSYRVGQGAR